MALLKQGFRGWAAAVLAAAALGAWGFAAQAATSAAGVTAATLVNADKTPGEWLGHGRDYSEQRFSPLTQIDASNVKGLGLAWRYDFGERQGLEATPIVHNGVIYVSTDFSEVWAFDARTGRKLWSFDPDTHYWQINTCCSPVNRGVAIWGDKVYVGALDGRLIALNARTGKVAWSTRTFPKTTRLSITGAPRVIKGVVIIGNGGAELGVRGFVAGYDAETGRRKWKFYMVPGKTDHDGAASDAAMKLAYPTWHGHWWDYGGGGTPWDGMAYDPKLDLLYVGGGNGSPWNAAMRSPGGGDNLFLGSIVALKPKTGKYVWHFQETPGDSWDYTSTQPIILADIKIDGEVRKTLLHAPKNGFFYVLDRATGKFISGKNYGTVNWAKGLDANGRPIENPAARYGDTGKPFVAIPGPAGAHDWQPMSYSPRTGLVYIPAAEGSFTYRDDRTEGGTGRSRLGFNTGAGAFSADVQPPGSSKGLAGADTAGDRREAYLLAWDPIKQEARFKVPHQKTFNGGILSTAGGLVFEGSQTGVFSAYRDDTGEALWSFNAQTGIIAGPASYELDGVQYIAVMAGWGGTAAPFSGRSDSNGPGRLLVFKLGGKGQLPPKPDYDGPPLDPPAATEPMTVVDRGASLYSRYCQRCHGGGAAGGGLGANGPADLRRTPFLQDQTAFDQVVVKGELKHRGMAPFGDEVGADKARDIRAYIIHQANQAKAAAAPSSASPAPAAAPRPAPAVNAAPLPPGYVRNRAPPPPGAAPGMKVQAYASSARQTYRVTMAPGDDLMNGLLRFAIAHPMAQAQLSGLGGVSSAVLAWYDPKVQAFKRIEVNEKCEIAAINGSISPNAEGQPYVHLHVVLTRQDGSSVSGHLVSAVIAPSLEVFVTDLGPGADVAVP